MGPRARHLALLTSTILCAALLLPVTAHAQWDLGVRGGVYADGADPFVGFELLHRMGDSSWWFNPNFEAVFVDDGDLLTVNGDFHHDLATDAPFDLWAGAGLAVIFRDRDRGRGRFSSSETELGVNLLAGVGFASRGALQPYIQGKAILADDSEASLAFGIRF